MDLQEYVDTQAKQLFDEIKAKLGSEWDTIRVRHESDIWVVAKYLAEYTFKSRLDDAYSEHMHVLEAIVKDFAAIGTMEAQSVLKAVGEVVKEFAKSFATLIIEAGVRAGVDSLRDSLEN